MLCPTSPLSGELPALNKASKTSKIVWLGTCEKRNTNWHDNLNFGAVDF